MADKSARERTEKAERDRLQAARKTARQTGDTDRVQAIDNVIDGLTAARIIRDDRESQERGE